MFYAEKKTLVVVIAIVITHIYAYTLYIVLVTWVRVWYGEIFHEQADLFSRARGKWKYSLPMRYKITGLNIAMANL